MRKNASLIRAFELLMAQKGMPTTAITERPGTGRGPLPQAYRRRADGKTILLRTNSKLPQLMIHPQGENTLDSETYAYDLVAAVFGHPGHPDRVQVYLIPFDVAKREMLQNQQAWYDADQGHARDNLMYVIRFDDAPEGVGFTHHYGYADKWSQYRVGDIELTPTPAEQPLEETGETPEQLIERHRQEIAHAMGVLPEAVEISIRIGYEGRDGRMRSAFIR